LSVLSLSLCLSFSPRRIFFRRLKCMCTFFLFLQLLAPSVKSKPVSAQNTFSGSWT
jgi:hypothetical protein